MYNFYMDCVGGAPADLVKCSENVMWKAGADVKAVEECVKESFVTYDRDGYESDNKYLEEDLKKLDLLVLHAIQQSRSTRLSTVEI